MYKIDDEFRHRGRVFMKATRENETTIEHPIIRQVSSSTTSSSTGRNLVPVPVRKSSLKKGPAITTNLDDRNIQFEHEVTHEKSVEALITEYPPHQQSRSTTLLPSTVATTTRYRTTDEGYDMPDSSATAGCTTLQEVTRNKRTSTEILGSSFESKKLSQRAPDGHRRITTHIVRKVTTLSRAEENAQAQNLVKSSQNRTIEMGYMTTQAIEGGTPAPQQLRQVHLVWDINKRRILPF